MRTAQITTKLEAMIEERRVSWSAEASQRDDAKSVVFLGSENETFKFADAPVKVTITSCCAKSGGSGNGLDSVRAFCGHVMAR